MKKFAIVMALAAGAAQAEVVLGAGGMYTTSSAGSTTYITQNSTGVNSTITPNWVPPSWSMSAPDSGSRTYITPTGTYVVSRSGSTTFVIQSGTTRGR